MSTAVLIGNGEFPRKAYPRELIRRADRIICCDRGLEAFLRHRDCIFNLSPETPEPQPDSIAGTPREPDAVIGDMDSLRSSLQLEYSDILVTVEEQEGNDQTKAFRYTLECFPDVDTIHILAATGKREDHTIGNLSLLMEYARKYGACGVPATPADGKREIYVDMVSDHSTAFAVTGTCELLVGAGRRISLFSPDNSLRIRSHGLQWPTDNVVFDNWWKATLNRASADRVTLTFSHPSIALLILD